jgi:hypothetical protein
MGMNLADGLAKGLRHGGELGQAGRRHRCRWRSRRGFTAIRREMTGTQRQTVQGLSEVIY